MERQYGTIFPDYSISLTDPHLKECWKLMVGVEGLQMVDSSEFLSVMIQTSFQLTNIIHLKLKESVLKDCVSVGLNNAQFKGISYDSIGLPNNWYFQYKSLADEKKTSS